jgi:phosphoenolpyruvate-protein kinase (PTS system EI component)
VQLRAILHAAADTQLRILVPMVTRLGQMRAVREALVEVSDGQPLPQLGAMIETREAAANVGELARELDFLSLGTNDLTQSILGLDRESSGTAPAAHPAVLRLIEATIRAGQAAGIPVEVCGEAASDPATIPLLVGLGADELSVGAARVGEVRELVRGLDYAACRELAERALLDQAGHAGAQSV